MAREGTKKYRNRGERMINEHIQAEKKNNTSCAFHVWCAVLCNVIGCDVI